jgi:hypothetical protein
MHKVSVVKHDAFSWSNTYQFNAAQEGVQFQLMTLHIISTDDRVQVVEYQLDGC